MKLKLYTPDGSSSTDKDFDLPELPEGKGVQALRDVLVAYQANARQGSANTKNRAEVRGTGKKVYRQKGTGHARHGDRQSPIYVGGGVVFGPKPRDYTKHVNRKVKRLALSRAVVDRANTGDLLVIESFQTAEPKTRLANAVLQNIQPEGSILIVSDAFDDNTLLSVRNIERAHVIDSSSVNPWDLVRYSTILVTEKALQNIIERCVSTPAAATA